MVLLELHHMIPSASPHEGAVHSEALPGLPRRRQVLRGGERQGRRRLGRRKGLTEGAGARAHLRGGMRAHGRWQMLVSGIRIYTHLCDHALAQRRLRT